ncbi:hypothetical protein HNR60_002929 [Rhodopseudomonas rhenobacensis]|uniref:Lipoprotein n=1 Tax=Rhodopseudomonas rhenobacensis TaxID=87461 RepID=A0A7W8DZS6_9BRAD|nr:hypothetical protein [Rhodopseudomonas rhenobacensis]MBB5048167.1 hypothetical protein [Rhodopseudomonas rhenobacensis]
MRVAYRVVVAMSLSLLAGCVTAQQQKVVLSQRQSAFTTPLDGRWRKAHETRPVAILLGRAETTAILLPRRAALEASCYRGKPRVRLAYDVGLRGGPISVAYHFNDAAEQTGTVLVRGLRRNIVVIDYQPTATAFLAELRASTTLKVRVSRSVFEMHDAGFRWDPDDPVLKEVLAACQSPMLDDRRQDQPDDTDEALDEAIRDVLPEI